MNISQKIKKYIDTPEKLLKYKINTLKQKCILFQNQLIQIGLKAQLIYDFYTSEYFLQIVLFFGNKTDKPIQDFQIEYKGNTKIEMWIEEREKNKIINENSQYKQRIFLSYKNIDEQYWMNLSFRSSIFTLNILPIPVNIIRFVEFRPEQVENLEQYHERFKYTEEIKPFKFNKKILKNGLQDLEKYFPKLTKNPDCIYYGTFNIGTQLNEHFITIQSKKDEMKFQISSNQDKYIYLLLENMKFLLQDEY